MLQWGAESNRKLPQLFIPSKTAASVPEFAMEDLPSADLHPWFLALAVKDLPLGRTLMMMRYLWKTAHLRVRACVVLFYAKLFGETTIVH